MKNKIKPPPGWTRVEANFGMGLEAQWLFRPDKKPLCSLKADGATGWTASLLNASGISVAMLDIDDAPLDIARIECEQVLRTMGWEWASG